MDKIKTICSIYLKLRTRPDHKYLRVNNIRKGNPSRREKIKKGANPTNDAPPLNKIK